MRQDDDKLESSGAFPEGVRRECAENQILIKHIMLFLFFIDMGLQVSV